MRQGRFASASGQHILCPLRRLHVWSQLVQNGTWMASSIRVKPQSTAKPSELEVRYGTSDLIQLVKLGWNTPSSGNEQSSAFG